MNPADNINGLINWIMGILPNIIICITAILCIPCLFKKNKMPLVALVLSSVLIIFYIKNPDELYSVLNGIYSFMFRNINQN